jgi:hypothetical protein
MRCTPENVTMIVRMIDIHMMRCYQYIHQRRLGTKTSNWLSLQTPWGLVRPLCIPEDIKPASAKLQLMMNKIFSDMYGFMVVIFDNMLVLCDSLDDAAEKLTLVQLNEHPCKSIKYLINRPLLCCVCAFTIYINAL